MWFFILHSFSVLLVTALSSKLSFPPLFNPRSGNHYNKTGSTMSPLTSRKVDESSEMHSKVGNGFAVGGQRTATVNVENFPGFPIRILGPKLMDTIPRTIPPFWYSHRHPVTPRTSLKSIYPTIRSDTGGKLRRTEEPKTGDKVIVATGASAKRLGLKREEVYWHSGIRACVVRVGVVPTFKNRPLAVIDGGDSAAEEATYHPVEHRSYPMQCDGELLKNLQIRNAETGSEKDLAVNRLFTPLVTNPQRRSFRTQLQTDPDGYIVSGTTQTSVRGVFLRLVMYRIRGIDRPLRVLGVVVYMAALEVERLIAE
ncbi:hypothetical protein K435DRAFT_796091 [Dendrothele bispora CBS 962.96]|uniref:FAD/NAD(P)-binding domain-containing protein n=1 Tax=Dendrothele bispora (strain CBS 962.96) TaxID=1314807 RepID=A0A4S8M6I8_DENBC|nr:hypothetical protein K435DRAFT_796091 [Dendrothele bispora CBS 962.96]